MNMNVHPTSTQRNTRQTESLPLTTQQMRAAQVKRARTGKYSMTSRTEYNTCRHELATLH